MRHAVILMCIFVLGCSPPLGNEQLVPLEVSGTVTVGGQPTRARIELWDSQWSDTFADDVLLEQTNSGPTGEYHLSTRVERGGCGQWSEYYISAVVSGFVHTETGELRTWSGHADVHCGTEIVDIDIDLPEWLAWPTHFKAAS